MYFTPREYQKLIGNFIFDNERSNVFAGMGMGKTSESIAVYDALRMFGEAKRVLIIAPRRVAVSTWPDEIVKWRESFGHLTIAAAIGTPAQRIEAIKRGADITTINYDNLEWLIEVVGDYWPWDMVICDEATRLKGLRVSLQVSKLGTEFVRGQGSKRAKALSTVAFKKVRRWVNLTGSPAPNGLQDLWAIQYFVDQGRALGVCFDSFMDRYFKPERNANGFGSTRVLLPHSEKLIHDAVRPSCITVQAKDWFNLKDTIERVIPVRLPPKARRIYDDMERKFFAEIEAGQFVQAFNTTGKSNKCLQIGSGFAYTDTETKAWEPIHDEKIEALRSIVAETAGEPLLVSYQFIPEREMILKAFPRAKKLDNNPQTMIDFQKGRIPMLVVHPASAGHGLNLQDNCRILVDFCSGWNLEYDEQVIERVGPTRQHQAGHDREVYRYRIVAEDTTEDTCVLPRLKTKASVQDVLKDAMARRNLALST